MAERFARDGFAVMINYAASAAPAEELARKIKEAGGLAAVCKADVSQPEDVRRLFAESMTAILAKELRGRKLTVNAIAPGPTATDLFLGASRRS